eukprot:8440330-Pyramimonas_sp.AAC.1
MHRVFWRLHSKLCALYYARCFLCSVTWVLRHVTCPAFCAVCSVSAWRGQRLNSESPCYVLCGRCYVQFALCSVLGAMCSAIMRSAFRGVDSEFCALCYVVCGQNCVACVSLASVPSVFLTNRACSAWHV